MSRLRSSHNLLYLILTCKRAVKRHQRVTLRYGGAVGAGGSLRSPNYRCAGGATWTHSRIVPSVSPSTSSRMDADRTMIAKETRPGSSEPSRGELRFLPAGARTQRADRVPCVPPTRNGEQCLRITVRRVMKLRRRSCVATRPAFSEGSGVPRRPACACASAVRVAWWRCEVLRTARSSVAYDRAGQTRIIKIVSEWKPR